MKRMVSHPDFLFAELHTFISHYKNAICISIWFYGLKILYGFKFVEPEKGVVIAWVLKTKSFLSPRKPRLVTNSLENHIFDRIRLNEQA